MAESTRTDWQDQLTDPDLKAFELRDELLPLPIESAPGGRPLWPGPDERKQLAAQRRLEADERARHRRHVVWLGRVVVGCGLVVTLGVAAFVAGRSSAGSSYSSSTANTLDQPAPNYDPTTTASAQKSPTVSPSPAAKPTPTETEPAATAVPTRAPDLTQPPSPSPTPNQGPFLVTAIKATPDGDVQPNTSVFAKCLQGTSSVVLVDHPPEPADDFDPASLAPVPPCPTANISPSLRAAPPIGALTVGSPLYVWRQL